MRREERVTVQGPVKEQQPDGMSHRGRQGRKSTPENTLCEALPAPAWEGRVGGTTAPLSRRKTNWFPCGSVAEFCLTTQHLRRGWEWGGCPTAPPHPSDPDFMVGNMKFAKGNIDLGHFWYTNFRTFGFQTPPPPLPTGPQTKTLFGSPTGCPPLTPAPFTPTSTGGQPTPRSTSGGLPLQKAPPYVPPEVPTGTPPQPYCPPLPRGGGRVRKQRCLLVCGLTAQPPCHPRTSALSVRHALCLGMHWKGGRYPPRAPGLCQATVSLTPSANFNGICNRQ